MFVCRAELKRARSIKAANVSVHACLGSEDEGTCCAEIRALSGASILIGAAKGGKGGARGGCLFKIDQIEAMRSKDLLKVPASTEVTWNTAKLLRMKIGSR